MWGFHSAVHLILSVTLEVVLRLRLGNPGRRLLLVHTLPRGHAHARAILGVSSPQVVVADAALVVAAHVWVGS